MHPHARSGTDPHAETTPASTAPPSTAIERMVATCRGNPVIVDAVLAAVVLGIAFLSMVQGRVPMADQETATLVALAATLPIAFRRAYPMPAAFTTAGVAVVGTLFFPGTTTVFFLPAIVMGYSAIAYGPRWAGPTALTLLLLGVLGPLVLRVAVAMPQVGLIELLVICVPALIAVATWLAGLLRRAAYRHTEQLRERARLLETGRRQEVRIELLAERSRISREVHDVVAHSLSGIIAQADGGQFVAQRDPQRAVDVLAGISATGRESLAQVRGLLEMLRDNGIDDDSASDAPQPGTAEIPALVEQVRAGGLPVELHVSGAPGPIGTGAELAVYRAVQEALTNVIKHAGPAVPTRVRLYWTDDELTAEVRDEGARGPAPSPPRGGHGLIGMRERAALHGGSVETGPHPDGGWTVRLRLPLRSHR